MLKKKQLSHEANNFLQLRKLVYSLFIKKKNNKREISKFKKIGKNILNKYYKEIRTLI